MSRIRSKDAKPELIVRKFLFSHGFRYRLNQKNLPGKPDIVLKKYKTVIFVNGCFWHGHKGCKYFVLPKTRAKWWKEKIERNVRNDRKKKKQLSDLGYNIITSWERRIKDETIFKNIINNVKNE
jgi:DNA mismatch endonuclease (patch repair protein)